MYKTTLISRTIQKIPSAPLKVSKMHDQPFTNYQKHEQILMSVTSCELIEVGKLLTWHEKERTIINY